MRGVLFDWRGTLVHDPPCEWWVAKAMEQAGRKPSAEGVQDVCERMAAASGIAEVIEAQRSLDCSSVLHREASMLWFRSARLDEELAEALYALDFEPANHRFFPDVGDTLRALHDRHCRVAVVSDIHFDLRAEFAASGFDRFIDAYVLSFEHGVQKPNLRIFEIALDAVGLAAQETLMVGDRASHDGGATALGITTLLLPPVDDPSSTRGLNRILSLIQC